MSGPPLEQNTHSGLLRKLERDGQVGRDQLAIVDRCCQYYAKEKVIVDDIALPLHEKCPACTRCWAEIPTSAYPKPEEAAISVPWVGPGYFAHRVCAVGINAHSYGGLGGLWWIAGGAIKDLQENHPGPRPFHFQVGKYLAVLLEALDGNGAPGEDDLDSAASARSWPRCAFLEAVKCSPRVSVSKPKEAMWEQCPSRYLHEELRILAPTTILAVGRDTWNAVAGIGDVENVDDGHTSAFWRGATELDGKRVEIFFVHHPSFGNWKRSLPELIRSVGARPPHAP